MEFALTPEQQHCFEQIENTNENFILMGKPGVGKSVLINALVENGRKTYTLAAPTGLAALNIGGRTLHSIFRIPSGEGIIDPSYDVYTSNENAYAFIKYRIKHLIIDEVSMVRADVLDYIDRCLRAIKDKPSIPFGGIQVVLVGDFFQLPPVCKAQDKKLLQTAGYATEFAFSAHTFHGNFKFLTLSKVLRQKDSVFMGLLNSARTGDVRSSEIRLLNERVGHPGDIRINLTSTNKEAEAINYGHLNKIPTPTVRFVCTEFGEWPAYPCERELSLKVGAQVMVKKNGADRPPKHRGEWESLVVNGSLGKVLEIHKVDEKATQYEESDGLEIDTEPKDKPVDRVVILLDSGQTVTIYPKRWERKVKFRNEEGKWEEQLVASFTQIPLQLAWAISIHKSQGQSFDKVHISPAKIFAAGQMYVALSRCRSIEGLTLQSKVALNTFWTNKDVVRFYNSIEEYAG